MDRDQDELGTAGDALAYTEVEGFRISSEIDGVRERSKGAETDRRAVVNRAEDVDARERDISKSKRIHNIMEDSEGLRYRLISELQGLQRDEENFDHRIEDLGVHGDKRVQLVASAIDNSIRQGEAFQRSQETVTINGGQGQ